MRMVVVLPQPDGPSRTRNSLSHDLEVEIGDGDEAAELLGDIAEPDGCHGLQPLTAPKESPRTRCFWTMKAKIMIGMQAMKPAALISPQ